MIDSIKTYTPPTDLLNGRIILITGASSGIGRMCALAFARHGATVILLGKTKAKLESTYDAIMACGNPEPGIYPLNLIGASPHDYEQLANTIRERYGRLHGLLHNAAMLGPLCPLEHYPIDQWYTVLQTNLNAPFLMTKALLPLMKQSPDSTIVFTLAEHAFNAKAYFGAYGVSKSALHNLMQMLTLEIPQQTPRINAVSPTAIRTSLFLQAYPACDPSPVPLPDTLMPIYLYLFGPDSQTIHGKIFGQND